MRARNWTHSGSQMLGKGSVDVALHVLTGTCLLRGRGTANTHHESLLCRIFGAIEKNSSSSSPSTTTHIYTFKADKCSFSPNSFLPL